MHILDNNPRSRMKLASTAKRGSRSSIASLSARGGVGAGTSTSGHRHNRSSSGTQQRVYASSSETDDENSSDDDGDDDDEDGQSVDGPAFPDWA
ncbi:hypothetical protein BGZ65_000568, partial [Modicella reniformis]